MRKHIADTRSRGKSLSDVQPEEHRIYLLYGNDDFLVAHRARQILDALLPMADRAFALEEIDGALDTPAEVANAIYRSMEGARTPSFVGGRKVVWLKGLAAFGLQQSSEALVQALNDLADFVRGEIPENHTLIVTARKVDGRSAFAKACSAVGEVQVFDVPEKPREAAVYQTDAMEEAFAKLGIRATPEVLQEFQQRVGGATREIIQEAEKLAIYLGNRKEATVEDVRAVTCATRESAIWDLTDAVGKRNLGEALAAMDRLLFQGEEPVGMMTALENKLRDLLLYRGCIDRGWLKVHISGSQVYADWARDGQADAALAKLPRDPRAAHPYAAAQMAKQAAGYSAAKLQQALGIVLETHRRMFASNVPVGIILPFMLIRLFERLGSSDQTVPH